MRQPKEQLPIALEVPGAVLRSVRWGAMSAAHAQLSGGTDFTPVLQGLPGDRCHCPHWGYVVKGALHFRHADGNEEVIRAGELWYAPPGHTAWCDEDTEYVDFSPTQEFEQVIDHVRAQVRAAQEAAKA
jgi:hypothetical protein